MTSLRKLGFFAILLAGTVLVLASFAPPAARAAAAFGDPIVVVYPLAFPGAKSGNEAGADVAIVIAQKLAEAGGVVVKPYIPGTQRADYLAAALSQRADYYITGFLQTIGLDVTMIVQVVSTHSGSVVFSTTTTIRTFGDAGLQADSLREAILRHAGRGYAALSAPTSSGAEASAKPTNGPGVDLTRALRKRHRTAPVPSATPASDAALTPVSQIEHPAPTATPPAVPPAEPAPVQAQPAARPTPAPTPARRVALVTPAALRTLLPAAGPAASPTPGPSESPSVESSATAVAERPASDATNAPDLPSRRPRGRDVRATPSPASAPRAGSSVLVVDGAGGEPADLLAYGANAVTGALRAIGVKAARLPIAANDARANAASICQANVGTVRLYAPTLILGHDDGGAAMARLAVEAIDCTGASLGTRTTSGFGNARGGNTFAIDRAAAKMVPLLTGI